MAKTYHLFILIVFLLYPSFVQLQSSDNKDTSATLHPVSSPKTSPQEKQKPIYFFYDDKDKRSSTLTKLIQKSIQEKNLQHSINFSLLSKQQKIFNDALVITIGEKAFTQALKWSNHKEASFDILSIFISSKKYPTLLKLKKETNTNQISAIFHDAPLLRQILLFKEILPTGKKIGLLIQSQEESMAKQLSEQAKDLNISLSYEVIDDISQLRRALLRLISSTDAIIAHENATIYNRNLIKSILLTLYRHKKFLIGSNKQFVKAGSIASTYVSPQQLIQDLIEEIGDYNMRNFTLFPPRFSKHFSIAFNEDIANSLNLPIINNKKVKNALQTIERYSGNTLSYE